VVQLCLFAIVIANLASFTVSISKLQWYPPSGVVGVIMLGIAWPLLCPLASWGSNLPMTGRFCEFPPAAADDESLLLPNRDEA